MVPWPISLGGFRFLIDEKEPPAVGEVAEETHEEEVKEEPEEEPAASKKKGRPRQDRGLVHSKGSVVD